MGEMVNLVNTGLKFNVDALANYLEEQDDLFRVITTRQDYPGSAHKPTETIFIRGPKEFTKECYQESLSSETYKMPQELANEINNILVPFIMHNEIKELGRVLIVKLKPLGHLTPHIDEGYYSDYFTRFHIPIKTNEECFMYSGDDKQHFDEGYCWWFNHKELHSAENMHRSEDRIHLIIDAVSRKFNHPNDIGD